MTGMGYELGRFWYWLQQGGNSNVVLVAVTIWYAILTHRIMKATARQANALLQPVLSVRKLVRPVTDEDMYKLFIENVGTQPIVFMEVTILGDHLKTGHQ